MILGILLIVIGLIYLVNPNAFRSLNNKWTSTRRNSMLPKQYENYIRRIAVVILCIGIYYIYKNL